MLIKHKERYHIIFKAIAITVMCLLLLNDLAFALAPNLASSSPEFREEFSRIAVYDYIRGKINPQNRRRTDRVAAEIDDRTITQEIAIIGIDGLMKHTAIRAFTALEKKSGVPVIYVDPRYFNDESILPPEKKRIALYIAHKNGNLAARIPANKSADPAPEGEVSDGGRAPNAWLKELSEDRSISPESLLNRVMKSGTPDNDINNIRIALVTLGRPAALESFNRLITYAMRKTPDPKRMSSAFRAIIGERANTRLLISKVMADMGYPGQIGRIPEELTELVHSVKLNFADLGRKVEAVKNAGPEERASAFEIARNALIGLMGMCDRYLERDRLFGIRPPTAFFINALYDRDILTDENIRSGSEAESVKELLSQARAPLLYIILRSVMKDADIKSGLCPTSSFCIIKSGGDEAIFVNFVDNEVLRVDEKRYEKAGLRNEYRQLRIEERLALSGVRWLNFSRHPGLLDPKYSHYRETESHGFAISVANGIGRYFYSRQMLEQAEEVYKAALSLDPFDADIRNNLGALYMALGDDKHKSGRIGDSMKFYVKAEWCINTSLNFYPAAPIANFNLIRLYTEKIPDFKKAMKAYRECLKVAPHIFWIRYRFGLQLVEAGEFNKAYRQLCIARDMAEDAAGMGDREAGKVAQASSEVIRSLQARVDVIEPPHDNGTGAGAAYVDADLSPSSGSAGEAEPAADYKLAARSARENPGADYASARRMLEELLDLNNNMKAISLEANRTEDSSRKAELKAEWVKYLDQLGALYKSVDIAVKEGEDYPFYQNELLRMAREVESLYREINIAFDKNDKKTLFEANKRLIGANRRRLKYQLLSALMMARGKSGLNDPKMIRNAVCKAMNGALYSCQRLKEELSMRAARLRVMGRSRQYPVINGVGERVYVFKAGKYDMQVTIPEDRGKGAKEKYRKQVWIKVRSRVVQAVKEFRRGNYEKAQSILAVLRDVYSGRAFQMQPHHKEIPSILNGLIGWIRGVSKGRSPPAMDIDVSGRIGRLIGLAGHERHKIWMDIETEDVLAAKIDIIKSVYVQFKETVRIRTMLNYYLDRINWALTIKQGMLSGRDRQMILKGLDEIKVWLGAGIVDEKYFSAKDIVPVMENLKEGRDKEARADLVKIRGRLDKRILDLEGQERSLDKHILSAAAARKAPGGTGAGAMYADNDSLRPPSDGAEKEEPSQSTYIITQDTDLTTAFDDNTKPIIIEVGFGGGLELFDTAKTHPEINYVGIDNKEQLVNGLAFSLKNEADNGQPISNLKVICAKDIEVFTAQRDSTILEVYYIFTNQRDLTALTHPDGFRNMVRALKPGGKVFISTDNGRMGTTSDSGVLGSEYLTETTLLLFEKYGFKDVTNDSKFPHPSDSYPEKELVKAVFQKPFATAAGLLKKLKEDGLFAKMMKKDEGLTLEGMALAEVIKILSDLGILVPIAHGSTKYIFSDMMRGRDDIDTKTYINALQSVDWSLPVADLKEFIRMAITSEMEREFAVPEGRTIYHIIEQGVIPQGQRSTLVTEVNKKFDRENKGRERIRIVKENETIDGVIAEIRAKAKESGEEALIDVALSDESHVISIGDNNVRKMVFASEPGCEFIQLEGVIKALRALHYRDANDTFLALSRLYSVMAGIPPEGHFYVNDSGIYVFKLPRIRRENINDIPKLNKRLIEALTAA